MNLRNEIDKLRIVYGSTEKQFTDIIHIIPLDNHYGTHSPNLFGLLHDICGQIEYLSRRLCEEFQLPLDKKIRGDFPKYYNALNKNLILEYQNVYVLLIKDIIKPFITYSKSIPDWWDSYNQSKHDYLEGIYGGNIGNTLHALAGLYTLHHIAYYMMKCGSDIFDQKQWNHDWLLFSQPMIINNLKSELSRTFHSEIFYCMTRYNYDRQPIG